MTDLANCCSGYVSAQTQYDQYGRRKCQFSFIVEPGTDATGLAVSNPQYPYAADPAYAAPARDPTQGRGQPPAQGDERRRRNR